MNHPTDSNIPPITGIRRKLLTASRILNRLLLQWLFLRIQVEPRTDFNGQVTFIWYLLVTVPLTGYFGLPLIYLGKNRVIQSFDVNAQFGSESDISFWLLKFDDEFITELAYGKKQEAIEAHNKALVDNLN